MSIGQYRAVSRGDRIDWKSPDYTEEYRRRAKILTAMRQDPTILEALKIHYRHSCVDFIQDWGMTYDPRRSPSWRPFLLWERQVEFIGWLGRLDAMQKDGLVEKSRDCGVTWLCMAYAVHSWLFRRAAKVGFGSRKVELVDRLGDPDSIMEKGRMILRYLPPEFLPSGYIEDKHAMHLRMLNPETRGMITGEGGDHIGRGGRNGIYFVDEAGFLARPLSVEASLSANTDCRIDVSTVPGMSHIFKRKRDSLPSDRVFIFDWRDDPRKNEKWYQEQVERFDEVTVAREIDRDYSAAEEGLIIPGKWVKAAVNFKVGASGKRRGGLDVADEGADANALALIKGPQVLEVFSWHRGNTTQTAHKARMLCRENKCADLRYDRIGVGAGVRGALESLEESYQFESTGIAVSESPTSGWYIEPDAEGEGGILNKDMFLNLRAEAWWTLRKRFERTFEVVNGIRKHPPDELISIPDDRELQAELSSFRYKMNSVGKVQIESKEKAKTRGIKSPNKAEALMLAYCPVDSAYVGVW